MNFAHNSVYSSWHLRIISSITTLLHNFLFLITAYPSMPTAFLPAITGPAAPYVLLVFGFFALLVVDLLLGLIEGVALTLLSWNPSRTCIKVSFLMNIISGLINGILLILLQNNALVWLPVSFAISLLVEGFILTYFKRDALRQNSLFVLIANLASYTLLILPAFYFGTHP
jgi:hypothetical protein